jgi:transcriptional regulator with XRE-family HTH domain
MRKYYYICTGKTRKDMCKLRIKELARERHVTMKQIAKALGYAQPSSLNQAMARGLKVPQLEDIARVLGVDVPDLFERTRTTIQCPHCGKSITIKTED